MKATFKVTFLLQKGKIKANGNVDLVLFSMVEIGPKRENYLCFGPISPAGLFFYYLCSNNLA